jgi:DNA invertase Pin-like site-specific DNA recombinase
MAKTEKPAPKRATKKRQTVRAQVRAALALMFQKPEKHKGGKANLLGYARVSTNVQELGRQLDALKRAKCSRVFSEKVSGVAKYRPAWEELMGQLRPGDVVVVHAIDRIGRSMEECMRCMRVVAEAGAQVRSISEPFINPTLLPFVFAMTESQRAQLIERTKEGLAAARERGNFGGRPTKLTEEAKKQVRQLHASGNTVLAIAQALRLSKRSVRRALEQVPEVSSRQLQMGLAS